MKKIGVFFLVVAALTYIGCSNSVESGPETYSITYNGNSYDGGTVPTDNTAYEEGNSATVAEAGTMSRAGYTFAGWNTAPDGNGMPRAAGAAFAIEAADVTLYAQWTANSITSGKLTVEISNAAHFTGHSIYYSIFDSNSTDPTTGIPNGNILGQAQLIIVNNAGTVVTVTSITDPTEKVFDNGTYYLGGMVDMNDNAATMNYFPDSGDRYGGFVPVEINGDTTLTLTENDFSLTIP
ncbi:MAG: InlB B-repeat-containing protein [Candidatus Latescibacteria bacterium]|nr:InlB B-repeat-containing protein [Candidatus Latescibacterota bacterium]